MSEVWDGRYATSRYANQTMEEAILEAGMGRFAYESGSGGLITQSDNSINVYGPSDSPKGHWHEGVRADGTRYGHD